MERKFRASLKGNTVRIINNRTETETCFDIREFVFGQGMYNEKTEEFPDYIHESVWKQYRRQK